WCSTAYGSPRRADAKPRPAKPELDQPGLGEIPHKMAGAVGPGRAVRRQSNAVDQRPELLRRDGDHVADIVREPLARLPTILDRREHGAEIEGKSVRILMMRTYGRCDQLFGRPADLRHRTLSVENESVLALDLQPYHRRFHVGERDVFVEQANERTERRRCDVVLRLAEQQHRAALAVAPVTAAAERGADHTPPG